MPNGRSRLRSTQMPARPQPASRCGDLERSCAEVLKYFAAVLADRGQSPASMYVADLLVGATGFEAATSSSRRSFSTRRAGPVELQSRPCCPSLIAELCGRRYSVGYQSVMQTQAPPFLAAGTYCRQTGSVSTASRLSRRCCGSALSRLEQCAPPPEGRVLPRHWTLSPTSWTVAALNFAHVFGAEPDRRRLEPRAPMTNAAVRPDGS